MKPLNMSRSEISFGGILQPLIESLQHNPRQAGRLVGQDVVVSARKDVQAVIALDSENDIHLLIAPAAADEGRFSQLELQGLKIANREWAVGGRSTQQYLDITCATGSLPSFRRPFLRFAEDVLYEISKADVSPADAAHRTVSRWRRFWSTDNSAEISTEWTHGLFGELTFLADLVQRFGSSVLDSWSGPLGKDHDFQTGIELGVEVKTSVEMPFKIQCNIRQLDPSIFQKLYIVCYNVTASESGTSLPDLVEQIESLIGNNEEAMDRFYQRLAATGYSRQLETNYRDHPTTISQAAVFHVNDIFPKIAEGSFVQPLDHRISNIRYTLQLVGIPELKISAIIQDLVLFAKHD
jgi:hypothetical protein